MAKKEKKKKGNYGKVLGFCAVVACLAALLGWGFGGNGFGLGTGGFGPFGGSGDGNGGDNDTGSGYTEYTENQTANEDPNANPDEADYQNGDTNGAAIEVVRTIRVVRDDIFHGQQQVTIGELEYILDELYSPNEEWEIVDEQAISEVFDAVLALMIERGINPVGNR